MSKRRKMPKSEKRIAANRRNAQKSTGPITDEGKAIVAQNALTHGMLAQHVLISSFDPAEHEEELAALLEGLMEDFKPKTTKERMLIERMAASYWRLRRAYRFEADCIDDARRNELESPFAAMERQISGKKANPFRFIIPNSKEIDKLQRYEGIIDRSLHRSLMQMHRLRRILGENHQPKEGKEDEVDGRGSVAPEDLESRESEQEVNEAENECDGSE